MSKMATGGTVLLRTCIAAGLFLVLPQSNAAFAGCLLAPAKLSDGAVQAFRERPSELLMRHPAGGPRMSAEVMRYVGSDATALSTIVQLAGKATPAQRVAIGIGLAKVASVCVRTQPELETEIKQAIVAAGLAELSAAFAAGLSSLEMAVAAAGGDAPLAGAPLAGNGGTEGGGDQAAGNGGGGSAVNTVGTELLTFSVQESTLSVRGGGEPAASLRGRSPVFSGKGITYTYGSTVSPTRP